MKSTPIEEFEQLERVLGERPRVTLLPLVLLALLGLQSLLLLLLLFIGFKVSRLADAPRPTLVQLVDGQAVKARPVDASFREPLVIDRFIKEWLQLSFNWSGQLPDGSPDPGVAITGGKIPTSLWTASFALSQDFRRGFLQFIATELLPRRTTIGRQLQQVIVLSHVSQARPTLDRHGKPIPGDWSVAVVGHWLRFSDRNYEGEPIPFNKRIYLRAVSPPLTPLTRGSSPQALALEQAVYRLREAGLEIYSLEDLPQGG